MKKFPAKPDKIFEELMWYTKEFKNSYDNTKGTILYSMEHFLEQYEKQEEDFDFDLLTDIIFVSSLNGYRFRPYEKREGENYVCFGKIDISCFHFLKMKHNIGKLLMEIETKDKALKKQEKLKKQHEEIAEKYKQMVSGVKELLGIEED